MKKITDHSRRQEQASRAHGQRRALQAPMAELIAGLAPWKWNLTFAFGDAPLRKGDSPDARTPWVDMRSWGPGTELAARRSEEFLTSVRLAAGDEMSYVLVADFGPVGRRYHQHALVAGVEHLDIDEWQKELRERIGKFSLIVPYDKTRRAAAYLGKHALNDDSDLRFGGRLAGTKLPTNSSQPDCGRIVVAPSAAMPTSRYFRMNHKFWGVR